MNSEKIEKIEDLIILGPNQKIIDHKIKQLTAPGDNYDNLMLSVDIIVKTPDGTEEIKTVAKMIPPSEFMQEMFNVQTTFPNEIAFYEKIIPLLQNFQREHGVQNVIDFFAKHYGSRLNLNGGTTIDSDGVLVLENLKAANFVNLERTEGFNLDVSKLVIIDLAYLHAVPLALKMKKPEVFEKEIKPYFWSFSGSTDKFEMMINSVIKAIEKTEGCKPFLKRAAQVLRKPPPNTVREPFATISHNDCWVNNTMQQFENGKLIKNKLVDFQMYNYGSPAKDVLFFLFSSVKSHVLEKHYDDLIKLYHNTFISALTELHCDTTPFSFEAFEKELEFEAKNSQFGHIVGMFFPIFASRGTIKDISEMKPTDFATREPTDLHKQKLAFVIREFVKGNWI